MTKRVVRQQGYGSAFAATRAGSKGASRLSIKHYCCPLPIHFPHNTPERNQGGAQPGNSIGKVIWVRVISGASHPHDAAQLFCMGIGPLNLAVTDKRSKRVFHAIPLGKQLVIVFPV